MDIFAFISLTLIVFSVYLLMHAVQRQFFSSDIRTQQKYLDKSPFVFNLIRPVIHLFIDRNSLSVFDTKNKTIYKNLENAGLAYAIYSDEFIVMQYILAFIGLVFVFLFVDSSQADIIHKIAIYIIPSFIMFWYPRLWLYERKKKRLAAIGKELSLFIDLLTLSIRAGLNIHSALDHASTNLPEGPLKDELGHVMREIRTGINRREALYNLSNRLHLSAISSLVAALNQAEETGGELGTVLLSQAQQRRKERFSRAEKLANQTPVKLLAPLIGLLFPITFIIIFFPIYIKARNSGAFGFFFQ